MKHEIEIALDVHLYFFHIAIYSDVHQANFSCFIVHRWQFRKQIATQSSSQVQDDDDGLKALFSVLL